MEEWSAAASGTRVSGEAKGVRSQVGANRSTGQSGAKGFEARGRAAGSSGTCSASCYMTHGLTSWPGIYKDGTGLQTSSSDGVGGLTELSDDGYMRANKAPVRMTQSMQVNENDKSQSI